MKQVILSVPGMQSAHCQARVDNALKGIEGVQIQSLEAGKLTVSIASDQLQEAVVNTIEKAGYAIFFKEDKNSPACATGCCSK